MRRFIFIWSAIFLFAMTACNQIDASNPIKAFLNTVDSSSNNQAIAERMKVLEATVPVSSEQLQVVFPETIDGLQRQSFLNEDGTNHKIVSVAVAYVNDTEKKIKIKVMDGAGSLGIKEYQSVREMLESKLDIQTKTGFAKIATVEKATISVKQHNSSEPIFSEIQWLYHDRFIIIIQGDGYNYNELIKLSKTLQLNSLVI